MIPNILYKYVLPERVDILLQKRIRFTQPCFLNDPFEFKPGMPVPGPEGLGHFEKKIAGLHDGDFREKSLLCGVLSLTEKGDSIPMWTHYAAAHRGFAIGFDAASGLFRQAFDDRRLLPVSYRRDRISYTRGTPGESWVRPDAMFRTKSEDWTYEQEWRWIECGDPADYAEMVSGPSGELLFLRPIPPESIRQIILGFRASPSLSESIQVLKLTRDYGHLEVFRVDLSQQDYVLEISGL